MNTIFHFDSIYQQQNLSSLLPQALEFDFSYKEGIRGYCDLASVDFFHQQLDSVSFKGIHFIGSGNYHYISLFFLEKINFPFSLIVFDHHTDMQYSMFGDLLSCGGWIRNAITTLPFLKEVLLIGVGEESLNGTKETTLTQSEFCITQETETFLQCQYHKEKETSIIIIKEDQKDIHWHKLYKNYIHFPYYLSIDKDVLSKSELETDWDQGNLSLIDLTYACKKFFNISYPIGIDICGEPAKEGSLSQGKEINEKLISFFYTINNNSITG